MNTQTHLLLALAACARRPRDTSRPASTPAVEFALLAGALLPDASLFVMWGYAKLSGIPDARIWSELYYSDVWQDAGAATNSLPLFIAVAAIAWYRGGRLTGVRAQRAPRASIALAVAVAAALHALGDLPLHHDDGHPHFWPFSDWIYASPVSYWDPRHHGDVWSVIESVFAALLIALLWRRFRHPAARVALVLAGLSYAGAALYWSSLFGGDGA